MAQFDFDKAYAKMLDQLKMAPQGCEVVCSTQFQLECAQKAAQALSRTDLSIKLDPKQFEGRLFLAD